MISDRATICPHCGFPVKNSMAGEIPKETTEEVLSEQGDEEKPKKASKALIAIDIILAVIAVGFGCYLYGGGRLRTAQPTVVVADTLLGDTVVEESNVEEEPAQEDALSADTVVSYSEPEEEEQGFKTSSDVENFVMGTYWSHGDVTLTITTEGIFANGNKISTSRPRFTRRTNEMGEVAAQPNISITVKYESRTIVDNNNGDVYEENND